MNELGKVRAEYLVIWHRKTPALRKFKIRSHSLTWWLSEFTRGKKLRECAFECIQPIISSRATCPKGDLSLSRNCIESKSICAHAACQAASNIRQTTVTRIRSPWVAKRARPPHFPSLAALKISTRARQVLHTMRIELWPPLYSLSLAAWRLLSGTGALWN